MRHNLPFTLALAGASFCFLGTTQGLAQTQGGSAPSGSPTTQQPGAGAPGAGSPNGPMQERMPGAAGDTQGASQSSSKMDDQAFVQHAASGGMMEVEVGKLAQQKSSNDAVKQLGERLVQDHTKANDQLKQVASKAGMTVPDTLDPKHQGMVDKLSKLSGEKFDKAFTKAAVKDHQQDIKMFQKESESGANPDVKSFASTTLPVLQEHLSMAKNLKQSHGASGASGSTAAQ